MIMFAQHSVATKEAMAAGDHPGGSAQVSVSLSCLSVGMPITHSRPHPRWEAVFRNQLVF